jgi:putative ABC transport system substrate-binding protein
MLFAFCLSVKAQQPGDKLPLIGYLVNDSVTNADSREAFQQGLRVLGYVEGKTIHIEYRYADGKFERYPALAEELVRLHVKVLVVSGGTNSVLRVKNITRTVPIVFPLVSDPVRDGIVASLARPGGNLTGLSSFSRDLLGKRLELLKETVPKLSRVGVMIDPNDPGHRASFKEIDGESRAVRVAVQALEARSPGEFEKAFRLANSTKAGAVLILPTSLLNTHRKRIAQIALDNQMPTMIATSQFMDAGNLMSYGPDYADLHRRAATYVDKILKGAKPAELPVEQPTKFELVINLKSAKQIGLTIPPNVLARADKVIR